VKSLMVADRVRLAKLLALLGSDHAGERAAAAMAAHRLVEKNGLTWRQVLEPPAIEKKMPEMGTWRSTATACLLKKSALRDAEISFLTALPSYSRISVKQRFWLNQIADRVLGPNR
jgi:hypothetical protein